MECNREEASMVKMMAEKKFMERDIIGAKKLALKAKSLYPDLDGLSQFLATLDVYIASEQRTNGEINWYRVLGVEPSANDDIIRRNYRKLALVLHPDKNKSVGAEGAFKIVSQAWGLLCDKPRRLAYDQKRNLYHMYQNVPIPNPPAPPPRFSPDTFWTLCKSCKTQFEYRRFYLNSNLVCQTCGQPFFAFEVPPPPENGNCRIWTSSSSVQGKNLGNSTISNSNIRPGANLGGFCKEDTGGRVSLGAKISDFVSVPVGDRLKKKRCIDEHRRTDPPLQMPNKNGGAGNSGGQKSNFETGTRNLFGKYNPPLQMPSRNGGAGDSGGQKGNFETGTRNLFGKFNQTRELSQQELRNLLVEKAKKDIQLKLNDLRTSEKETGKGKQKIVDTKISGAQSEPLVSKLDDDPEIKGPDPVVSMDVPDPDFHDFDEDRTEMSFGPNQVWAAYDNDDGMPRFYAMVHSVTSLKPLRMRISWLNTKNNRELGPLDWIGSGFFKTSGIFWIGKHEVNKSLNSFSHKVKWEKGKRGFVTIYPRKGDVWAIYNHWSPDWNAETPDEVIHNYTMVEVLEDFNEEEGVFVIPLIKVAGFKTVFSRHPDSSTTKKIPKAELFRLSHQVPSHVLTGNEGRNVPKGCLELDPASMPLELLQVFTEVQVKEMVENAAKGNILPVNGEKSELQSMEDGEKDGVETSVKKEKVIVYKRKRGRN